MRYALLTLFWTATLCCACSSSRSIARLSSPKADFNPRESKVKAAYDLEQHYTVAAGFDRRDPYQFRFFVFDAEGQLIFKGEGQGESQSYDITSFRLPEKEAYLILGHLSSEYSWGLDVHIIREGAVDNVGFINTAIPGGDGEPRDCSECIAIEKNGKQAYKLTFSCDELVYDPGGPSQTMVKGKDIYYLLTGTQLKEVKQ